MPPSNAGYYHAAYIAAALIYLLYGLTIVLRARAVRGRLGSARREGAE